MFKKSMLLVLVLTALIWAEKSNIHHEINATVDPASQFIQATDKITIPAAYVNSVIYFLLNSDLKIESQTEGVSLKLDETQIKGKDFGMDREDFELSSSITQNKYALKFDKEISGDAIFTLKFSGKIHNPVKEMGEEYARGFSQTPGIIDAQGVYLGGSTYWVPWFNEDLVTFELTTILPESWDVVSQGKRTLHELKDGRQITTWSAPEPMEEVYLIAAQFNEYSYSVGAVDVMAFLRTPDENLANKYLETTAQYLEMYRKLLGPYPFSKFALIENFWETGYGMASFTLLGPQVIRFPFILHSSYPHELLHNWWGNSAYVDFETGNWCEGITVYMADHLIKEQRGQGLDYRRSTLQKFTDYVTPENDFPLTKFLSRHNASSEAIGYGKSMMAWNMLREDVGDEQFMQGFQKFYRDNKYKFASFGDIKTAFEEVTGNELDYFFDQWITRTGAPELQLSNIKVSQVNSEYKLAFTLKQIQKGDVYNLNVPVAVSFAASAEIEKVNMTEREQNFGLSFSKEPLLVQIDPQFHLFRKLHPNEIPPSLSKLYGSEKILILLPAETSESQSVIYKQLSGIWSKDKTKNIEVKMDSEISKLPADQAVWVFGLDNKFSKSIAGNLKGYNAEIKKTSVRIEKSNFEADANSIIVTTRHPNNPNSVIALLSVDAKEAIPGLARKLLHYGKYSYLAFEGTEPTNIAKGQWPAVNSPLSSTLAKGDTKIFTDLKKRKALATLDPVFNAERMMDFVNYLADAKLKGRAPGTPELDEAADYIAEQFKKAGLQPGADDGSYFQVWEDVVDANGTKAPVKNVIAIIPGTNKDMAGESVVVSAHYDHLGLGWPDVRKGNEGKIHFGADDNASGVAVMMELASLLGKTLKPQRTIVFVAFTLEENGLVGSKYYVKNSKRFPVKKVIGNLNLDTIGRLGENKLLVLNTSSAREWRFIFMGAGYVTGVDAEMVTQELDASDQMSFIKAGVPGVQFFSGANHDYHRPSDTIDKIDAAGMVKVATFVRESILYLAERKEPLSFKGIQKSATKMPKQQGTRSATTGSMPDFTYSGTGVKIGALSPDSPAAKAGLQKGDVIVKLGEFNVTNLRDYSTALKNFSPDDKVKLIYKRNDIEHKTEITLIAR